MTIYSTPCPVCGVLLLLGKDPSSGTSDPYCASCRTLVRVRPASEAPQHAATDTPRPAHRVTTYGMATDSTTKGQEVNYSTEAISTDGKATYPKRISDPPSDSYDSDFVISFNEMQEAIFENANNHGWHDAERTFGDFIALAHSELSEALEAFRDSKPDEEPIEEDETGKPVGIASELADVVIRLMDMCEFYNIDLAKAILVKHRFNVTREYRHGGKRL